MNVYDYKTQQLAHTLTADNPKSRGMSTVKNSVVIFLLSRDVHVCQCMV